MCEEVFGPVVAVHVYPEARWSETLRIVDETSPYALTGAVFARERAPIREAFAALRHAAGNFYINDKPTGAVVGQQPFGGGRASGTNDKAGSDAEPAALGQPAHCQGDLLAASELRIPVHE
jgi:1-pyrroline-5-carboxylate dehydrogenase